MSNKSATDDKTALINVFKNCLNILRDNEGLIGDKALRTMSFLIILKMIEPHFGNEIDIDDYQYDFSHYEDSIVDNHKKKLLEIVRFSNLAQEKEDNIPQLMKCLWDDILSCHPTTKKVFLKEKGFDIQHKSTYKKIIEKLNSVDLVNTKYDVLGNAYEEVIQGIMTGKVLGQFFTQPLIKKMMVKLIDPQIHADGTIDTCCDPTMGTGGFLITYLQHLLQQAESKNIKPDWFFIKTEGLYGKELEPDTYQLAVSNMLISSGHMFDGLEKGDSIRVPITRKFDNILANPPFGIKGLRYDDFESPLKNEYIPIKSDNAVSLFLQSIIHMVKVEGKCAVVLPDGQDLFSKTNKTLVAVREYLIKTCDLQEIIYLPSGLFTYTAIKTCVFYFVKKVEGKNVLERKIKVSKNQKEICRDYTFVKDHQTAFVKFYNYDSIEDVKTLIVEVPIERIAKNAYSLNYAEYLEVETKEYGEEVIMKTLGEICIFIPKSKRNAKFGKTEGQYPFFRSSTKIGSFVNEPDHEIASLIIGDGGEPNINYGVKFSASDHCYILQAKSDLLLKLKYVYYYLHHNMDIMEKYYTGVGLKNISKTNIESIILPIPSLERQNEVVEYLDFIYEKSNKTSNEKILELKMLNEFCLKNQKIFGNNVVRELHEISSINPESMKLGQYTEINYVDIASVKGGEILELQKLTNNFPSRAKRIVKKYDILYSSVRPNLKGYVYIGEDIQNAIASTGFALIRVKNTDILMSKYLYYFMTCDFVTSDLIAKAKGAQYPTVSFDDFNTLKISIPSIERQKEMIEYCESNELIILQLKSEIEKNKKQALQFITSVMKAPLL